MPIILPLRRLGQKDSFKFGTILVYIVTDMLWLYSETLSQKSPIKIRLTISRTSDVEQIQLMLLVGS